jgi:hypothetical protein
LVRAYALVEHGDTEAVDVFLRLEDAEAALADCLVDEPEWKDVLRVVPIESRPAGRFAELLSEASTSLSAFIRKRPTISRIPRECVEFSANGLGGAVEGRLLSGAGGVWYGDFRVYREDQ